MVTQSTISIELENGTVLCSYCYRNGFLNHNGKILLEHYQDPLLVRELISFGGMLSLGKTIASTKFYIRDYGKSEEEHRAKEYSSFHDYLEDIDELFHEFNYILRQDGNWYVYAPYRPYLNGLLSNALSEFLSDEIM